MSFGQSKQKSEAQQKSFIPAQETSLTDVLTQFTEQGRIGAGQTSFPDTRVAPLSSGQQTAISGAEPFLDIFSAQREIPFLGETGGALQGILSGELGAQPLTMDRANDIFTQSRQLPAERSFERFTQPAIDELFAGPGFLNEDRPRESLRQREFLQQGLRGEREAFLGETEMFNRQAQENQAGRALSAIPLGMQAGTLPEQVAGARLAGRAGVFDFLSAEQQQQQREISVAQQVFAEAQRFMDPEDFANLTALLGLNFSSGSSSGSASAFELDLSSLAPQGE